MATPTDSTTTFSGRLCTRTRVRTATSIVSSQAAQDTSTTDDLTSTSTSTSTTTSAQQQVQTSAAAVAQPPAAPPAALPPAEASSVASSSDAGTSSPAPPVAQSSPAANVAASSAPAPAASEAPDSGAVLSAEAVTTAADNSAAATTSPPASSALALQATTSAVESDTSDVAATLAASNSASQPQSSIFAGSSTAGGNAQSDQSTPTAIPSDQNQSALPTSTLAAGGAAGVISPDSSSTGGNGLTIGTANTNVAGLVGGVIGGVAGVAMISIFLFWCLRKRKSREPFEKWQKRVSEKDEDSPGISERVRGAIDGINAKVAGLLAKMKSKPEEITAQRAQNDASPRSSFSSMYSSSRSAHRNRSSSEPPTTLRQQLRDFGGRMPSLKRSKTLLQKKQDSLVVGSKSPFPGIVEDPVVRNSKGVENPFADPSPSQPQETLQVPNPGAITSPGQAAFLPGDGLRDQQRAPIAPRVASVSDRGSRDPFASILDELESRDGSGTPEWLKHTSHRRSQSAATALRSHPPSGYSASVYTNADNPFFDPSDVPPVPNQPLPPNPPRRPANAYAPLPTFNATSSMISRDSDVSFFFGEPGPSRPTTNMFSSQASPMPRLGRQSDPFDLEIDRIGFGNVNGRREVRGSVTRQNSKSNRTSTVPNLSGDDNSYGRLPARNPSFRR